MIKIAHVIHPVVVDPSSDLTVAQPVTFETMKIARQFAAVNVHVVQFFTKYHDETPLISEGFDKIPDLTRSVRDVARFQGNRKLALIKDILDRLYEATDADYMIYTNVDIALMPFFYIVINRIIESGYDAFIINRRTISKTFRKPDDIPLMYSQVGEKHRGYDCFVLKRSVYPKYQLGNTCIGTGRVGAVLAVNLIYNAKKFKVFTDLHATFHIGNDKVWKSPHLNEYFLHNENELKKVLQHYGVLQNPIDNQLVKQLVNRYGSQSIMRKVKNKLLGLGKKANPSS